ncbi:RNA-guided endonuclease InsQ/TnpB family protein [Deinococcus ruber]|uniref:Transposase n=1 Tax=Deinococcus ruber TaxID=1848197 RepID=A0A918CAW9_9DEIO|nr:transposase [Deinococcus ruber]GGR15252.1 hypothetical protein GCM10008957_29980 [Deinococcus ruber]
MMRAYKYRLSPSRLQELAFQHHLDLSRELYNAGLQERRDAYRKSGVSRSFYDQKRCLPEVKEARPEFEEVHAHVLQGTLETLDKAFKGFFSRVKAGSKAGYPRFRGRGWWDSFRYQECSTAMKAEDGTVLGWKWTTCGRPDPDGKRINLPKIGKVKVKMHRPLEGRPKTLVIKREGSEWYAVYTCEVEARLLPPNDSVIGIDVGTRYLYTDSDGRHETNPKLLAASQRKLTRHSQSLARKKRGSGRRTRVKALLGKAHRKVARQRLDHSHKVANHLLAAHGTIVHEDLKPSKMVHEGAGLSRSIHDAAWTQLFQVLSLKAASAGRTVIRVDPSFTSQRCFKCGFICKENRLNEAFACLSCRHGDHADVNAASNIRELGIDPEGYNARSTKGRIGPAAPDHRALRNMSGDVRLPVLPTPV